MGMRVRAGTCLLEQPLSSDGRWAPTLCAHTHQMVPPSTLTQGIVCTIITFYLMYNCEWGKAVQQYTGAGR